jgi:acyl-homoserine lactone acylase PvdQ
LLSGLAACGGSLRSPLDPVPDGGRCARPEPFVTNPLPAGPPPSAPASLYRDSFGTPYAMASTDKAALYAFGYAQAQDHGPELAFLALQVEGRLAEVFGPDCAKSDLRMRVLGFAHDAKAAVARLEPEARETVLAPFAAGINAGLAASPTLPAWTRSVGRFDAERVGAIALFYGFALALANDPHGYGAFVAEAPWRVGGGLGSVPAMGSNAFALGGRRTASGAPIVAGVPHLALRHPFLLVEGAIKGERIDVHGFTFLGLPLPVFGFTPGVAWGVTIDAVDAFDRNYEALRNQGPPAVLRHGGWLPVELRLETVKVKGEADRKTTVRTGDRGPLLLDLTPDRAIALDWAGRGDGALLDQLFAMATARDLGAFELALARLGTPNYAFTAADSNGGLLYAHLGRAPDRAATFRAPGGPTPCASWAVDTVTDRSSPVAPCVAEALLGIPGWAEDGARRPSKRYDALPVDRDPAAGWSQSANTPPWHHAKGTKLRECPGETIAPCRDEFSYRMNDRGRRHAARLDALTRASLDDAADVFLDSYVTSADRLLPALTAAWARHVQAMAPGESARLAPAINLLDAWDRRAGQGSRAAALYHAYGRINGVEDKTEDADKIAALGAAVDHLQRHFGRIDPPWADVHRLTRRPSPLREGPSVELGIAGGLQLLGTLHALDGEFEPYLGSLVGRNLRRNPDHDGRERIAFGTAAALVVELRAGAPEARTAMIYGASDDPFSPHFADQALHLLGEDRLKPVPTTRAAIEAASVSRIELRP